MNPIALLAFLTLFQTQGIINDLPKKYLVPAPGPSKVVAKVNGTEIKGSDVEDLLWQWRGGEATEDLIQYVLVKSEAQKQNIQVTDKEVEDLVESQLKQIAARIPQGATVAQALAEQGFTQSRLVLHARTELLINKLVAKDIKPSQWVKISTILVRVDSAAASSVSDGAKKAQELYDRLKKGETWESVLNSVTQDPQIQNSKGLIGWRQLDVFPESSRQELAVLKPGQITKPVQTTNGFQIFRLEALGADAKGQDLEDLKNTYLGATRGQYITKLRAAAKIERFLPDK